MDVIPHDVALELEHECDGIRILKLRFTHGLRLVFARTSGPCVSASFLFPTETFDDRGIPHCLEHSVFLGSQRYPYKGFLDQVSSRCLCDGTNALTANNSTAYTFTSASWKGALHLLPIYADHVFRPLLREEGFITEIHHINGQGENGGVVYCEMLSSSSSVYDVLEDLVVHSALGNTSSAAYTGGRPEELCNLCIDDLREFHARYYRPDCCTITITGSVPLDELIQCVAAIDAEYHVDTPCRPRPFWSSPRPPMPQPSSRMIDLLSGLPSEITRPSYREGVFTADDPGCFIAIGWCMGVTNTVDSSRAAAAMSLMLKFLCQNTRPLSKALFETEMATDVYPTFRLEMNSFCMLILEGVADDDVDRVIQIVYQVLYDFSLNPDCEPVRAMAGKRAVRSILKLESKASSVVETSVSDSVLFDDCGEKTQDLLSPRGPRSLGGLIRPVEEDEPTTLQTRLNRKLQYEELSCATDEYWRLLLHNFIRLPSFVSVARPDFDLAQRQADEASADIERRRTEYGSEGLQKLDTRLQEAIQYQQRLPPPELLRALDIPDVSTICLHQTSDPIDEITLGCDEATKPEWRGMSVKELPFAVTAEVGATHMCRLNIVSSVRDYTAEQLTAQLFVNPFIFSIPHRGPRPMSVSDVILWVTKYSLLDTCAPFSGISSFNWISRAIMCVFEDRHHIDEAIQFITDAIFYGDFYTTEDARVLLMSEIHSILVDPSIERADSIFAPFASSVRNLSQLQPVVQGNLWNSKVFGAKLYQEYKSLAAKYESAIIDESCISDCPCIKLLVSIQEKWRNLSNLAVRVTGSKAMVSYALAHLSQVLCTMGGAQLPACPKALQYLNPTNYAIFQERNERAVKPGIYAVRLSSATTSFISVSAECPYEFTQLTPRNYANIYVLEQVLGRIEGPFWRDLRGAGLTYSYNLVIIPEGGYALLRVEMTNAPIACYRRAKEIVQGIIEQGISQDDLEMSRGSAISLVAERNAAVSKTFQINYFSHFRGLPEGHEQLILQEIEQTTSDELIRFMKGAILPLFEPGFSIALVVPMGDAGDQQIAELREIGEPQMVDDLYMFFTGEHKPALADECVDAAEE